MSVISRISTEFTATAGTSFCPAMNWFAGLRHPSLDTVFMIASKLGVRPSQLVAEVEKMLRSGSSKPKP